MQAQKEAATPIESAEGTNEAEMMKVQAEMALEREKFEFDQQMQLKEFELKQEEMKQKQQLAQQAAAQKAVQDRVARSKPQPSTGV